jgi:hypothetical protein
MEHGLIGSCRLGVQIVISDNLLRLDLGGLGRGERGGPEVGMPRKTTSSPVRDRLRLRSQ